jgi:signal transduction histidine kinase
LRAKVSLFADLYRKTRELELLNSELEHRVLSRTEELRQSARQIRDLNDQLQLRVAELESIMAVLPVGVSVALEPHCRVITGNAAFYDLLEVEPGKNMSVSVDERETPLYKAYRNDRPVSPHELPMQIAAATGNPVGSVELELHHRSGKVTQVLASANPLFDDSGSIRGAVGALIDITERKRVESQLQEQRERFRFATKASQIGYWFCDLPLDRFIWDETAKGHFWLDADADVDVVLFYERLHPEDRERVRQSIRTAISTQSPYDIEFRTVSPEGKQKWIHAVGRTAYDKSGVPIRFDGVTQDITTQLQAEEALRRSEKLSAMGRMAGIVAHEINNPLGSITNLFYLLRDHPSLDEEARNYACMAEAELSRVAHITKQTLGFYRESADIIPVSLAALLDEVLEFQARQIQTNRIIVDRRYRSDGIVQGFPGELKQVFLNLVCNAIEAMPEGGCLRLHVGECSGVHLQPGGVRISISDSGAGIRPEDAKMLFEPFFSTKSTKGTGLGLWISQGIIQKYEGTISFRSARMPGGNITCFSVFIPALLHSQKTQSSLVADLEPSVSMNGAIAESMADSGGNSFRHR